jgi:hypothetical protein
MSTQSAHQQSQTSSSVSASTAACRRRRTRARMLTVLAAAFSAVLGWVIAVQVLGVELVVAVGATEQSVGLIAVVSTSVLAGLAGWALLALLERRTARAKFAWTITAVTVLVLSMAGPLGASSMQAMATLIALHVAVGGVLIAGLRASSRPPIKAA